MRQESVVGHHQTRCTARRTAWILVFGLLFMTGTGCQSGQSISASALPQHQRATALRDRGKIDLSRLAQTSINSDIVYPGDVVEVTVGTGLNEAEAKPWPLRVTDTGEVDVPLVGLVSVAKKTFQEAEQAIHLASMEREIYRNPHVSMVLSKRKSNRVRVVGAVISPGDYELPVGSSDVLSSIVSAGGLAENAGTTLEIRHPSKGDATSLASFDFSPASSNAKADDIASNVQINMMSFDEVSPTDLQVRDGSVVMVQERVPQTIHVIGLVRKPNGYEIPSDQTIRVLDAIALAGGRSVELADKVKVIRPLPAQEEPLVINVSVREAKRNGNENLLLATGDVVSVEDTPATFALNTLRSFLRFGFSTAMPLF